MSNQEGKDQNQLFSREHTINARPHPSSLDATEKASHHEQALKTSSKSSNVPRKRVRLHGDGHHREMSESISSWHDAIEEIVQNSIQVLSRRYVNDVIVSSVRDLESTVFAQSLNLVFREWTKRGRHVPAQLNLFSNPVGLASFQVHERQYVCFTMDSESAGVRNSS